MGNIFKQPAIEVVEEKPKEVVSNKAFTEDDLRTAWKLFSESRKNQVAEYHLLSRGFELQGNTLHVELANPVEEPLLLGLKTDLTAFLREHVGNGSLQVVGHVQTVTTQKMAYTNKEKFEAMVQRNPMLLQLKEKFGLDPDF